MATATITITYTSTFRFTCSTTKSADTISIANLGALVALDAFKNASKLVISVVPTSSTKAKQASLSKPSGNEVPVTESTPASGTWNFEFAGDPLKTIVVTGSELRLQLKSEQNRSYEFAIVLLNQTRDSAFTPFGMLELIKLPPPAGPIKQNPHIGITDIAFPVPIEHNRLDPLKNMQEVQDKLPTLDPKP